MSRFSPVAPIAALLLAVASSPSLSAQTPAARPGPTESGIYVSADAYLAGKLEQVVDTRTGSHVIDRHTFLNRGYIDVDHDGKRVRYDKSAIFGYRDAQGHDIRLAGKREYTVVDPGPIYVYTSERVVSDAKRVKTVTEHYFSRTPSSPVLPLTLANLKRTIPDDHQFHHLLDLNFADGASLAAYDSTEKAFKINVLYRQAK
jgi:hypothetical protein